MQEKTQNKSAIDSFQSDPIAKVVIKNSLPALVAMIMVMVYNLADTFFLGLTHNDLSVTAVSFATPLFMIFMSLGTLFGVGGTSVISRALGSGDTEHAKKTCSFCMWACVAVGLVLMAVLWGFLDDVTLMLGAKEDSVELTRDYLAIAIGCGVFSMISNCFSSIVRTEGEAMKAMTGTLIGNLINMILDPIFILGFKWGVVGAAVATVIGNIIAAIYYIMYFLKGESRLSISIKQFSMRDGILSGVLSVGVSASLANLLVSVSSIIVNSQLSKYPQGNMLVAGYGVSSKVTMIVVLIGIGIGSGVQAFIGYCYGAKNKKRLAGAITFSSIFGLAFCFVIAGLCFLGAEPIVNVFLTDTSALDAGVHFTKILLSTTWLIGAFAIFQNALQAMGAAAAALFASILRQGVIFVPMMFILMSLIGMDGLIWAQPVADVLSFFVVAIMLVRKIKRSDWSEQRE